MASCVVVGFIDSPEGAAAVEAAIVEAERRKAKLILVNSARGGREDADTVLAVRDAVEAERLAIVERGIDVEVLEFARGNDPVDDLLGIAQEREAELIVIGLRRRSPVGKLMLGSNSQSILLHAECPVLAVKAPHA